mmetsp:Transcript_36037/g.99951  ORF Transcript_36037/g.99951 Transcript_36037/m.99951 type:complete len:212 (-) Transcript_36037:475-1110(-)
MEAIQALLPTAGLDSATSSGTMEAIQALARSCVGNGLAASGSSTSSPSSTVMEAIHAAAPTFAAGASVASASSTSSPSAVMEAIHAAMPALAGAGLAASALSSPCSSSSFAPAASGGSFNAPLRSKRPISNMNSPRSMVQSAEPRPVTARLMTSASMPSVSLRARRPSIPSRPDSLTPSQHCPMKSSSLSESLIFEISLESVGRASSVFCD